MASVPIIHNSKTNERRIYYNVLRFLASRMNPLDAKLRIPYQEIFNERLPQEELKTIEGLDTRYPSLFRSNKTRADEGKLELHYKYDNAKWTIGLNRERIPPGMITLQVEVSSGYYSTEWINYIDVPQRFIEAGLGNHIKRWHDTRQQLDKQNQDTAKMIQTLLDSPHEYTDRNGWVATRPVLRSWQQVFYFWPETAAILANGKFRDLGGNSKPRITQDMRDHVEMPDAKELKFANTVMAQAIMLEETEAVDVPTVRIER